MRGWVNSLTGLAMFVSVLAGPGSGGQAESFETVGLKIDTPVAVDGVLDEKPWARAVEANALISVPADRRDPSKVQTSLKILFDETFLYLGFECRDLQPEALFGQTTARDGDIRGDDSVFVLLEAADDENRFYFFGTNLLGASLDGRIQKDGGGFDLGWDGTWSNACRRTESGWTAELAIDLRALRFEAGKDWTLALMPARVVPRLDRSFWSEPLDPAFRVSELKQLKRVPLFHSAARGEWGAFALSSYEDGENGSLTAGIDADHVFSLNFRGRVALNPDFLTVTPDRERVNLTPYELFVPEQRPFFSGSGSPEGEFPSLFYSKRIGDIWGGARASGRTRGWEFSGLTAYSKRDSDSGLGRDPAFFAVGRLQRTFGETGSIGFTAANRLQDGLNAGATGLAGALKLSPTLSLTGQAALSYGPSAPGSYAFALRPSYDTETFHLHFAYLQIGEEFGDEANAVGFVRDDNRRELRTGLVRRLPFKGRTVGALSLDAQGGIAWGIDGMLRSWDASGGLELELVRKFTLGVHHSRDYKLFETDFRNRMTRIDIDFNRAERWQAVGLSVTFGRNFGGVFDLFELHKRLLFTRTLSFEYDLQRLVVKRDIAVVDPRFKGAFIHVLRIQNRFSRVLALDAFIQSNSGIDKMSTQVFFIYRPSGFPGTITTGFLQGNAPFGIKGGQGATFLVKLAPAL